MFHACDSATKHGTRFVLAHNSFTSYSDWVIDFDNNGNDDNDDIDDFKMVHVKQCANRGNYQTFILRKTYNVPLAGLKKNVFEQKC